jgi:hypothetical protein
MKNTIFAICLFFMLSACQDGGDISPANDTPEGLTVSLSEGNGMRISAFIEEGSDKTTFFNPYLFIFNSNGTVTASKDGQTVNGTYAVFRDDGKTELGMTFPNDSELYELNDDWYFVSQNENTFRFEDDADVLELKK